jgi:hypothetical protein
LIDQESSARAQDRADLLSSDRGRKGRYGPGAERGDGPGGAAGEHGDAGVRVADAVVPARRRVGAQDPHQGGHARQGRRHHRRLLRHRRGTFRCRDMLVLRLRMQQRLTMN